MLERLPLDVVHVVPAAVPPLRGQPAAGPEHRVRMVELAIAGRERLLCDRREIDREGVSYTVLTVEEMQRELPRGRLALILGRDAFDKLPKWHRFDALRRLADIVVINRPGYDDPTESPAWMGDEPVRTSLDRSAPPGRVVALTMPPSNISATRLRRRLATNDDVSAMLAPAVLSYIREHRLYA